MLLRAKIGSVEPFTTRTGKIAVLNLDQVDTDRIIPARFLSRVSRLGYGDLLFHDVRDEGFPLDQPEAKGAQILVVGTNFGCGSSREHAVWAIQQAGYFAVIARTGHDSPGYSDIFRQNSANCGLLTIELEENDHRRIVEAGSGVTATIDLSGQTVSLGDFTAKFDIDPATKDQLVRGLDLIGTTLEYETQIAEYERESKSFTPKREAVS